MGKYDDDLLIKTIVADTPEVADRLVNDFGKEHSVKATQSNPVYDFHQKKVFYVYTLFYLPKDGEKPVKILTDKPKILVAESDAKWVECLKCGKRWKWTHYKMCPGGHSFEGLPEEHYEEYSKIWLKEGMQIGKNGNEKDNQVDKGI